MTATAAPAIARFAPIELWYIMQHLLLSLLGLFGYANDVAAQRVFPRVEFERMRSWLRAGECVMRHLLLIEAAGLKLAPRRKRKPRKAKAKPKPRAAVDFTTPPETWAVAFRALPPPPREGRRPRRALFPKPATRPKYCVLAMAVRLEGLLRAFNDPLGHAKKMLIALRRTPRRLVHILRDRNPRYISENETYALTEASVLAGHGLDLESSDSS